MKRLFKTVAIVLLCGALAVPAVDAQTRGRNNGTSSSSSSRAPSNRNNHSLRPSHGGNNGNGGNLSRPNTGGQRPGSPGYNGPAANHKPMPKPNPYPSHNHAPAPYPGHGHHHGPMRPDMPYNRPFHAPQPPVSWHNTASWNPIQTILGIAIGTTFNVVVQNLMAGGATINSYGNNEIYVADAHALGLIWPDAVLYCDHYGHLYASNFVYSTAGYSMNRYNMAYTSLVNTYGYPVSVQNLSNGVETTWWGGGQFIRLSYMSDYANSGSIRYYTTLSYGNY